MVATLVLVAPPLGARPAQAHGELHGQIEAVSQQIETELRRPPYPDAGHERAKFFLERGELYRLHRDWAKAEADYAQALHWEPDNEAVELCQGKLYLESSRPAQARDVLAAYLDKHVDHPEALLLHAQALIQLGAGIQAVRDLDRALARHPQPEPDHYLARVTVLELLGAQHWPRAVQGLEQGLRKLGPIVALDEKAIELDCKLRRYDSALARIDRQAARSARKDQWLARRAEVLAQAGRKREAQLTRARALAAIAALPAPLQRRPTTVALQQRLLTAP